MNPHTHSWREAAEKTFGAWELEPEQGSFGRLWRVFMTARVAIAGVLVVLQGAIHLLGNNTDRWSIIVCIAYLCATLAMRLWARPSPPRSTFDAQWVSTIGVDVVAFSLLNFLQSSGINYTPLFALPVLLSSVLGPILLAFGTAASVTLLLLADAWWSSLQGAGDFNARFLQSGLSGSGFFLVALLANQLALRLARQEKLVKSSQSLARMQTQVNELVVETLTDGVLVVDAKGTVRSANPAARRLLAAPDAACIVPFEMAGQAAWQALDELKRHTFAAQSPQQAEINLIYPGRNARSLHVRSRLAASPDGSHESLCVMFLEDLREMQARVRIEKMAAMGRMSAAVAHEIRNPLAAISQANALLEEDLHEAGHRQLTAMVRQNAQRLAKIVDEVLDISRAQEQIPAPKPSTLMLDEAAMRIANDWARQNAVAGHLRIETCASDAAVHFDAEHLRRLMVNLLDNALRYASNSEAAIQVSTRLVAPGQARLAVWSDGQPLETTVQTHLFEPFFSSESRSSGLGLYICQELCERYGALIGYQRVLSANTAGNEFFVMFTPTAPPSSTDSSSLDTILV
jgi:two-component system sensor histidine kinase PilS (NtrC family)